MLRLAALAEGYHNNGLEREKNADLRKEFGETIEDLYQHGNGRRGENKNGNECDGPEDITLARCGKKQMRHSRKPTTATKVEKKPRVKKEEPWKEIPGRGA